MNNKGKELAPLIFLFSIFIVVTLEHFHPITNTLTVKLINIAGIFGMLISVKLNRGLDKRLITSAVIGLVYILLLELF